ncbi:MAG: Do family serine endopeptidase [Myxococcota bacterium]
MTGPLTAGGEVVALRRLSALEFVVSTLLTLASLMLSACQAAPVPQTSTDAVAAPAVTPPPTVSSRVPISADLARIPDVAEASVKSVVNISTSRIVARRAAPNPMMNDPFFRQFFGRGPVPEAPQEQRQNSLGSGVIVDDEGIVLTNHHVAGEADEIKVTLSDGREFEATRVGTDQQSDLAVLKLVDPPKDLVALPIGDSQTLRLGEVVLAIGNPFGIGQTVTMGIVSAKGRAKLGILDYEDFIQTDASINPGNSGGALVNLQGELVGINTAIFSRSGGSQGIGFAIPTKLVSAIMTDLLDDGMVDRGFLGVGIQELSDDLRMAMKLDKTLKGVLITDVTPGSAADKAGFARGDLVVEFNKSKVRDVANFRLEVATAGSGVSFSAVVLRDGKRKKLSGKLGSLSAATQPEAAPASPSGAQSGLEGLALGAITDEARAQFGIPDRIQNGALVVNVQPGSVGAETGLLPGDVIVEVDRRAVRGAKDVQQIVSRVKGPVLFVIVRQGALLYSVWRR